MTPDEFEKTVWSTVFNDNSTADEAAEGLWKLYNDPTITAREYNSIVAVVMLTRPNWRDFIEEEIVRTHSRSRRRKTTRRH